MMTNTLIVTSALNPVSEAPGVGIIDPEERLYQLCCSLLCWCEEPDIRNIIICDNTNPKNDLSSLQQLMESKGKKSEILLFSGDRKKVALKGKGYGEGEILRHIIMNSKLMQQCESFYKVTGRIYIRNFKLLHLLHEQSARVFDNPVPSYRRFAKRFALAFDPGSRHGIGMVRTIFYKCDKSFFISKLMERNNLVEDRSGLFLEHAYFYPLIRKGFSTFKEKPLIVGSRGGSGKPHQAGINYSESVKEQARKLTTAMSVFC